ncbi:hypothetical protein [Propionivibrio sp.]|uniref:hypothetical protein n=1 Tax=Propionivibrio sp. TaxID=2212460 RepID=UPI003BF0FAA7
MTTMISEVFEAFRAAGVPEDKARKAAEALSSESVATKSDINRIEKELLAINGKITLIQWMLGVVVAATVIPLLKPLLI